MISMLPLERNIITALKARVIRNEIKKEVPAP